MNLQPKNTYLPALTGVRTLAVVLVYLHHYNLFPKQVEYKFLFLKELHVGVTFFFVLSGFLIALRYFEKVELNQKWLKNYFFNRFARIYPFFFLLTTATYLFRFFENPINGFSTFHYILSITFLKGFANIYKFIEISQGWSLTVEECFYFSAPFFFILITKNKHYLWLIPLFLFGLGAFLTFLFKKNIFPIDYWGDWRFFVGYTFLGRCVEFFVGIYLARLFLQQNENQNKTYYTYLGIIMVILFIIGLAIIKIQTGEDFGIRHPFGMLINNILLPIFGIAIFFWGLLTEKTSIRTFLENPIMELLGKSSYILYLIHLGFIYDFLKSLIPEFRFMIVKYLIIFSLLNLIAIFLFKIVEEPLNRGLRKLFNYANL